MNVTAKGRNTYRDTPNANLKRYLPNMKGIEVSTPGAPTKAERQKLAQDGEVIVTIQFKDKPSLNYRMKPQQDAADSAGHRE